MEGATWKVPTEKVLKEDQMSKVISALRRADPLVWLATATAATSGLRLCEVYHLRAEDVLPEGRIRITRRKKKVLQSEVIGVSEGLHKLLKAQADLVKTGWLFPGRSKGCVIVHRPVFRVY